MRQIPIWISLFFRQFKLVCSFGVHLGTHRKMRRSSKKCSCHCCNPKSAVLIVPILAPLKTSPIPFSPELYQKTQCPWMFGDSQQNLPLWCTKGSAYLVWFYIIVLPSSHTPLYAEVVIILVVRGAKRTTMELSRFGFL